MNSPIAPDSELDAPWALPSRVVEITNLRDVEPRFAAADECDHIEVLRWHLASKPVRPDCDIEVLLQIRSHEDGILVEMGAWDGEAWNLAASGGTAPEGAVYAWAVVEGPDAAVTGPP